MEEFMDWFKCPHASSGNLCPSSFLNPGSWPLMSSYFFPLTIILIYYVTVTLIGPFLMSTNGPYEVSGILSVYNGLLAIAHCSVGCCVTLYKSSHPNYQPVLRNRCGCEDGVVNPENMIAVLIGIFHIIRLAQLIEGMFYIVRRRRVTLIKTTHHMGMVLLTWAGTKYAPGGTTAIMVAICCFTFSIAYIYYELSGSFDEPTFWPHFNMFVSVVQIIQFILIGFLCVTAYYWDCQYPQWGSVIVLLFILTFAMMVISDLSWTDGEFTPKFSLSTTGFGAPWFIDRS